MSETRPLITAGPIQRAFKFLKRTSVSDGAPVDGAGLILEEAGGVVAAGDVACAESELDGEEAGGDSSCANEMEQISKAGIKISRVFIGCGVGT